MELETYILPSYWASALINSDFSGYSDEELKEIEKFENDNREKDHCFACVGCSDESYFAWSNDANNLGSDVLEFTFDVSPISSYHSL